MSDQTSSQPTILIKKPDGTSVRVTLDEFKKMRGGTVPAPVATSQAQRVEEKPEQEETETKTKNETKNETVKDIKPTSFSDSHSQSKSDSSYSKPKSDLDSSIPELAPPHELATTTPVTDIFVDEARAKMWTPEDHRSPLEEDDTEIQTLKKQGVEHTVAEVKMEAGTSMASKIPKELMARFNALVLSYKKGVRSDEQFIEYVLRDLTHGGLGFSDEQDARILLAEVQQKTNITQKSVPQKKMETPITTETISTSSKPQLPRAEQTSPVDRHAMGVRVAEHGFSQTPSIVHDMVQVSTQQTTGPEDEIRNFSLVDFRRLSKDPKVAASMLRTKFEGWKEDSFLLFMKTRDTWKQSPLYTQYIACTTDAYTAHVSLKEFLSHHVNHEGLTFEEYLGVVDVNAHLMI